MANVINWVKAQKKAAKKADDAPANAPEAPPSKDADVAVTGVAAEGASGEPPAKKAKPKAKPKAKKAKE